MNSALYVDKDGDSLNGQIAPGRAFAAGSKIDTTFGTTMLFSPLYCCNLSGGVALIVWFTTNGMCVKNNTIHICGTNKQQKSDCGVEALPILNLWMIEHND